MEKRRAVEIAEKRKTWEERIKGWKESGLSQAEYCRVHELRKYQFLYWKKRITSESARLVEVPIQSLPSICSPMLSVVVGGVYRIELSEGFDPASVEKLLRVLVRL